jgi:outer membrane protein assembly factor BamB
VTAGATLSHASDGGFETLRLSPDARVAFSTNFKEAATLAVKLRAENGVDAGGGLLMRVLSRPARPWDTPVEHVVEATGDGWSDACVDLPPGRCDIELVGDSGQPVHLKDVALAGQAVDLAALAAAAGPDTAGDTIDYFTSFEETGTKSFLEYIPWLYDPLFVAGARIQQSSDHALNGTHSARFYEDFLSTSYLKTKALTVPANSTSVTLGGWLNIGITNAVFDIHLSFDGGPETTRTWRFSNPDVGNWVYRYTTIPVPAGAREFTGWIQLRPNDLSLSSNQVWLDDYLVDFLPALPAASQNVIAADLNGQISAFDVETGSTAWTYATSGGALGAPPRLAGGIAYFATSHATAAKIGCVSARTGSLIWSKPLPGGTRAGVGVWGQTAVTMTADGYVRTFAVADGTPGWTVDAMKLAAGQTSAITGSILDGDRFYATTAAGIYAIDVNQKTVLWKARTGDNFATQPALDGGTLYAGTAAGQIVAIDVTTGNYQWMYGTGAPVYSEPQVVSGVVLCGSDNGNLYGLHVGSGQQLWKLPFPGTQVRSFTFENGRLYVAPSSAGPQISCWAPAIGTGTWTWTRRWAATPTGSAQADPTLYGSRIFLSCDDRTVVALDASTGAASWTASTPGPAFAPTAVLIPPAAIDVSRRYDQHCWLCAHNAYANVLDGWWYAQQGPTIVTQLNEGVRALMLDTWDCQTNGTNEVIYQHDGCDKKWLMTPWSKYTRVQDSLAEIGSWLDRNRNEIVTIILEQRVANAARLQQAFTASGVMPRIFYADRDNVAPDGTHWNVTTQGWPSLAWMVAANLRLVVFSDWGKGNDGFPRIWDRAVENEYGNASRNGKFKNRNGSEPLTDTSRSLFVMNYNTTVSLNFADAPDMPWGIFDRLNDANQILSFVSACKSLTTRTPNFIAVDWYDNGFNGGPAQAVLAVNTRWAQSQ